MQSEDTRPQPEKRSLRLQLLAPADGRLLLLNDHIDALHQHQLAGPGFYMHIQSDNLCSPCDGTVSIHYMPQFMIRINHPTGLQCALELPPALLNQHGQGLRWNCRNGDRLKAGQSLLRFDPSLLQQVPPLTLTVVLFPAKAIHLETANLAKTVLAQQPCFTFQLHGTST